LKLSADRAFQSAVEQALSEAITSHPEGQAGSIVVIDVNTGAVRALAAPYTTLDGTIIDVPEVAVVVMVENAGEGSAVAAPIFRRIVELYYGIVPLTPLPWQR